MKNILTIILIISLQGWALAQLHIAGGTLKINSNALLHSNMNVVNTDDGSLKNEGTLTVEADLTNSGSATMEGDGQYNVDGDWTNSATYTTGTSTVTFTGDTDSNVDAGGDEFHRVELDKTDADLVLANDMTVNDLFTFASTNNKVILGPYNFILGTNADVTGDDEDDYFVVGGTGQIGKNGIGTTPFFFCVGFDENTCNPITLVQSASGVVDNFGVRVLEHALADGGTGDILTQDVVDASWEITEGTPGGSDLTLTMQWAASDELTGFDNTDCGVSQYIGPHWDLLNTGAGLSVGADPYFRARGAITEMGFFAVGGEAVMDYISVNPKAFLQGPFNGTLMNDDLRADDLIPLAEPYAALSGFTHSGRGGGENTTTTVLATTGNDAIVDWVFLELRDDTAPGTVIASTSALMQRDGDIVGLDGTSEVRFAGLAPDDFYLVVNHRNHLGVRTTNTLSLSRQATNYDFSTAASQANGTHPMADLGSSTFGLYGGDVNGDGQVYDNLVPSDAQLVSAAVLGHPANTGFFGSGPVSNFSGFTLTYQREDVDMDGNIYDNFVPSDRQAISNIILGHPGNTGFFGSGPVTNFSGVTEQID